MAKPRRTKGVSSRLAALDKLRREKRPKSIIEQHCIARLIRDLEGEGQSGLIWNEEEAQRNIAFIQHMRHWKGRAAGRRFQPEPFDGVPVQSHHAQADRLPWLDLDGLLEDGAVVGPAPVTAKDAGAGIQRQQHYRHHAAR